MGNALVPTRFPVQLRPKHLQSKLLNAPGAEFIYVVVSQFHRRYPHFLNIVFCQLRRNRKQRQFVNWRKHRRSIKRFRRWYHHATTATDHHSSWRKSGQRIAEHQLNPAVASQCNLQRPLDERCHLKSHVGFFKFRGGNR